jgi:hypothetical protein
VLGPNGPIPVDPWGPKYAKEAMAARQQIISGIKSLQKLGNTINTDRKKIANEIPLAPDDDDEVITKKAAKKKSVTKSTRKKR